MTVNRNFGIVSFGSGPKCHASRAISDAAKTGDAGMVLRALRPWGEQRKEVVEAILRGDYEASEYHVTVRVPPDEEKETNK